ncbi:MAG: hypothetical protein Q3971_02085 [Moraxella sp.]|nr:hypothetical protein [Moraxella sp.]
MPKTKLFSLLSNLAMLVNLVVGFLQIHWLIIPVFAGIHAVLRLNYLKAESELTRDDATQTSIAPPVIRNIASVITAVILALATYAVGYGVAYFIR